MSLTRSFFLGLRGLYAYCNCEAGLHGIYCKHRLRILDGEAVDIVSENIGDIETVHKWLQGTRLESALKAVEEHEEAVKEAQRGLRFAKKGLARIMDSPIK